MTRYSLSTHHAESVWKPLRGPVRDWPLAVCDRSTVDLAKDVKAADLVFARHAVENCQIHYSSCHKWYYLSDQQPEEAWVFLQSDSADTERSGKYKQVIRALSMKLSLTKGVPHSSFRLPQRGQVGESRESIEVRALVYYDDTPEK